MRTTKILIEDPSEGKQLTPPSSSSSKISEEKQTSIQICIQNTDYRTYSWFSIKIPLSGGISLVQSQESPTSYPTNLSDLKSYSFAVLQKSIIFFLGGERRASHGDFSNEVFAFSTITRSWVGNRKSMQSARAYHSAVAVKDKIYVFGCSSSRKNLTREQWGECYNFLNNTWIYLPQPPQEVYNVSDIISHAVIESQNLILLWVFCRGIYLFNYESNSWVNSCASISQGPRWSNRVAVVNDVIFWHYFGTIYAYDFTKDETVKQPVKLYTIQDADTKFGKRLAPDPDGLPGPTYLVHLGAGRLCLVWLDFFLQDKIHCYKFKVEREADGSPRIVPEDNIDFPYEGYDIEDVLELEL